MGKLIVVVGNAGVGKTTLTQQLCQHRPFVTGLERIAERPFQQLFADDLHRYALSNQIDYLLLRAEQEEAIRQSPGFGIQDGGLEVDFFVFTRRFYQKGYLTEAEYQLCARLYICLRQRLPPPDLIIHLVAPSEVIAARYARRNRPLEIAQLGDLSELGLLLANWISQVRLSPVITADVSDDDPTYANLIGGLLHQIDALTNPRIEPSG